MDRNGSRLYSATEAAVRLGVGRTTLYALLASGQLGSVSIGRRRLIPDSELERFIADRITIAEPVGAAS